MPMSPERKYWIGELKGATRLSEFMDQMKHLSEDDKGDLDRYAAAEMAG